MLSLVYWPDCLVSFGNMALRQNANPNVVAKLEDCFNGCKADVNCKYYSFDYNNTDCGYFGSLNLNYNENPNVVTGHENCRGTRKI